MARREDTSILDAALTESADRQTLAGAVTDRLRELILGGQLPPGQPLRPAHLAPRLGVSVMPVREALRILRAEGLVSITPRIGAHVAEINEEDIEELYLVRGALEGFAARLAVRNFEETDLLALQDAFDEMAAAREGNDLAAFSRWDREFHRRQFAAADRPSLVSGILERWDASRRVYSIVPRSSMEPTFEAHRAILEAVRLRDERAAEHLTRMHTEQALERILAALREVHAQGEAGRDADRSLTDD
jgi:DNA-binding GntR family transcriptional regulator